MGFVISGLGLTTLFALPRLGVELTIGGRAALAFQLTGLLFQGLVLVGLAYCLKVPLGRRAREFALLALISGGVGLGADVIAAIPAWKHAAAEQPDRNDDEDNGPWRPGAFRQRPIEPPETPHIAVQLLLFLRAFLVDYCRLFAFLFWLRAVAFMEKGSERVRDVDQLVVILGIDAAWWVINTVLSLGDALDISFFSGLRTLFQLLVWCVPLGGLLHTLVLGLYVRILFQTLKLLECKATGRKLEPV
jgi:hypothetical protein